MKLFTGTISPNGKRVQIAAAELGIPLERAIVDFAKGENRAADYLTRNPMGKVPTLEDGELVLWESAAIVCHLAHTHGGALWPADVRANSDMLRWLFFCSCHVDPYFTTLVVERFIKARRGGTADEAQVAAAEGWLARFLPVLEQQLSTREYLTGTFGLADIALGCTLELSPLLRFDLASYPHVGAWLARLQARASWRANTISL